MLIDSHCHLNFLNLENYQGDLHALITENLKTVSHMLCVGTDLNNSQTVIDIAQRYENIYASVGVHPSDVPLEIVSDEALLALGRQNKVVAMGETGLDYHYNHSGFEVMQESFRQHIRIANTLKLPLIIHTRNACEDTLKIMREEKAVAGVMHCFTEHWEMAEAAMEMGFYISFSGIITFKNALEVQAVAQKVPLEKLLIETDAPYLTPVPFRGKPNEPRYVSYVAEKIAELKGISYQEVVEATGRNFHRLFLSKR